jgi:fission process protein 1
MLVTAAYGISWIYLAGFLQFIMELFRVIYWNGRDVSYEAYKAHRRGPTPLEAAHFSENARIGMVAVQRAAFQSIASMSVLLSLPPSLSFTTNNSRALPALTIHTAVKQAKKAFINVKSPRLKTWGPTLTGLAIVPILPYLFDHPVEHAIDRVFEWTKERIVQMDLGGKNKTRGKEEL